MSGRHGGGGRRERGGGGRGGGGRGGPPPPPLSALQQGEELQQRADRRGKGPDAIAGYAAAAAAFEAAAAAGEGGEAAWAGMGECCTAQADALLESVRSLPTARAADEAAAEAAAAALFARAAAAHGRVRGAAAAVAAGNALASQAACGAPAAGALPLLEAAVGAYRGALALEEDALTCGNLADALVQAGEALSEGGRPAEAGAAFAQALEMYRTACELSDSAAGDSLPDLLCNWGAGALAAARAARAAGDAAAHATLLAESEARLRAAIEFARGDVDPHVALGEALCARAEAAEAGGGEPAAVAALYAAALADGYDAALGISRYCPDGLVGAAEAHFSIAKLAARAGDGDAAGRALADSARFYHAALQKPGGLGGWRARADVRYSYACVCALAGRPDDARAALETLAGDPGALDAAEAAADADLESLRGLPWFGDILGRAAAAAGAQ